MVVCYLRLSKAFLTFLGSVWVSSNMGLRRGMTILDLEQVCIGYELGVPNMDPKEKGPPMDLYKWPATSNHLQLLIFEVYSVN